MATEVLRPNAVGDETNIESQYPTSGEHWDKVDEETPDEATTRLYNSDCPYERDLYNLPASSGSGTINFIKIYIRCKRYKETDPESWAKPSLKSNSTVTDGTEIDLTTTWTTYSEQWNTNPADGEAWEWADIDALQIGVSLKSGSTDMAYCTQVYVEVDYTPVTPKTSSDAGSGADVYVSLEKTEAKTSSDTGSGAEGTPMQSAVLAGNETGSGIEDLIARLLTGDETGTSVEVGNLLRAFFVSEMGQGSDSLIAKIETPTKGGGIKLWT